MEEAKSIIDSSALLAYLNNETGGEVLADWLKDPAAISTVNWSEVLSWYARGGQAPEVVASRLRNLGLLDQVITIISPAEDDAAGAAQILLEHPRAGLSLADRFCLALAIRLNKPVITADKSWTRLGLACKVIAIR